MTITELQIQLDLNPDNRVSVLENYDICQRTFDGYLFVDSENGQCYLFDKDGNLDDISKVKIIGNYAFNRRTSLIRIKIPDSIKNIRYAAFAQCTSLTSIEIPNSIESIDESAFEYCTSLTSIKISNSVKSIGNWAFEKCISLKSIKIPDSVESIGSGTFNGCTSLESIEISSSIERIGYLTFEDCPSLKEVIFKGKTIDQVKAMKYYPWGIKNLIKVNKNLDF